MTLPHRARLPLVLSIVAMLFLGAGMTHASPAPAGNAACRITDIHPEQTGNAFLLRIKSDIAPTYTTYEMFNPLRVVIDIADADLADSLHLPLKVDQSPVAAVRGRLLNTEKPSVTRIELLLSQDHDYTVDRAGNDIVVTFAKKETAAPKTAASPATKPAAPAATKPAPATQPTPQGKPGAKAPNLAEATVLQGIKVDKGATGQTTVQLVANGPIRRYQEAKLPADADQADRLYIDIPEIGLGDVPQQIKVDTDLAQIRTARRGNGIRIVFDATSAGMFDYEFIPSQDGLKLTITPPADAEAGSESQEPANATADVPPRPARDGATPIAESGADTATPSAAPATEDQPVNPLPARVAAAQSQFGLSGYTQKRISVDFYKINLHNVFRLLGEISGRNIVVDEGVNGTLTLALNDVPWDFVLDIILNLQDLQKVERYNTIVISPKSKHFAWPEQVADKLTIRGESGMATRETLSIKQRIKTPKEVMEAKTLIHEGHAKYQAGDYPGALALYEKASDKWPDNGDLAKRIATLCLVQLGQNAKAVHYAKVALKAKPDDYDAATEAAIGLANMKKDAAAKEYFDLAVSGPRPSSEALTSYAAFCEQNENYVTTLLLLSKHADLYGDTMETMLAKARIHDKQGDAAKAVKEYRALLLSGYNLPPDLLRYIKGRLAVADR